MKWIKSLLIVLLFSVGFSLTSFAELNNAKNEDTQTLTFEIVGEKDANDSDNDGKDKPANDGNNQADTGKGGMTGIKKLLPKTGEMNTSFVALGTTILVGAILIGFVYYKKGKKDYEND